jgi:segregation and condensation protein B
MNDENTNQAGSEPELELTSAAPVEDERWHMLERVLEALLLASDQPLSIEQLHRLLGNELGVTKKDLRTGLDRLEGSLAGRAAELREVASGFRIQVRPDYAEWVSKLWQEKPPRLSRALLETLALVCYRQPITRGEIEEVRGVALSPNIIRTLLERGWIREVGVKEVPGRPSLFGTTQGPATARSCTAEARRAVARGLARRRCASRAGRRAGVRGPAGACCRGCCRRCYRRGRTAVFVADGALSTDHS